MKSGTARPPGESAGVFEMRDPKEVPEVEDPLVEVLAGQLEWVETGSKETEALRQGLE